MHTIGIVGQHIFHTRATEQPLIMPSFHAVS